MAGVSTSGSSLTAQVSLNIGIIKVVWMPFQHCMPPSRRGNLYLYWVQSQRMEEVKWKVKMIVNEADKITTTGGRGVQTELKTNHKFKEFLLVMLLDFVVSLTSSRASSQFNL